MTNILLINGINILDNHHNLTQDQVNATATAQVNQHAIQNTRTMYQACKESLEGDLLTLVFQQDGNIPDSY